jgi:plastocyanin
MSIRQVLSCQASILAIVLASGCGGDSSPTAPSGGGSGSGSPGPSGATITIGANGAVAPSQVTISMGQSVTFVNNHSQGHQIASNPHPTHGDCPPINALGTVGAGETKQTNAFTVARTCGFHDHNDPGNAGLQGAIVIQ